MMGTVHALLGAAIGSKYRNRLAALSAGISTHAAGDMMAHKEAPGGVDAILTAGLLLLMYKHYGLNSSEMVGAIGGLLPDTEHFLHRTKILPKDLRLFPTHNKTLPHPAAKDYRSQITVGLASVLYLTTGRKSSVKHLKRPKTDKFELR